jgi:hypothetical protein
MSIIRCNSIVFVLSSITFFLFLLDCLDQGRQSTTQTQNPSFTVFCISKHALTDDANTTRILHTRPATTQISVSSLHDANLGCGGRSRQHLEATRGGGCVRTAGGGCPCSPVCARPCLPVCARPAGRSAQPGLAWISPVRAAEVGLDLAETERAEGVRSAGGFDGGGAKRQSRGRRESESEQRERGRRVGGGEAQGGGVVLHVCVRRDLGFGGSGFVGKWQDLGASFYYT